jgi:hypothetical protein
LTGRPPFFGSAQQVLHQIKSRFDEALGHDAIDSIGSSSSSSSTSVIRFVDGSSSGRIKRGRFSTHNKTTAGCDGHAYSQNAPQPHDYSPVVCENLDRCAHALICSLLCLDSATRLCMADVVICEYLTGRGIFTDSDSNSSTSSSGGDVSTATTSSTTTSSVSGGDRVGGGVSSELMDPLQLHLVTPPVVTLPDLIELGTSSSSSSSGSSSDSGNEWSRRQLSSVWAPMPEAYQWQFMDAGSSSSSSSNVMSSNTTYDATSTTTNGTTGTSNRPLLVIHPQLLRGTRIDDHVSIPEGLSETGSAFVV